MRDIIISILIFRIKWNPVPNRSIQLYTIIGSLYSSGDFFMREFAIRLRSVQDVQEFVDLATAKPFVIQVCDDRHRVNAKSFMEMFSLNFANRLTVQSEGYDWEFDQFLRDAQRFLVNE